jgi:hypothetical protein
LLDNKTYNRGYQISEIQHLKPVDYPKIFFFTNGSPKVQDEVPACLKNGGFFKTSQLNDGGFAYI